MVAEQQHAYEGREVQIIGWKAGGAHPEQYPRPV